MKMIASLKSGILAGAAAAAAMVGIAAAQNVQLDDVLRAAREERRQAAQENREREARFLRERDQQAARLRTVRAEVVAENRRSDELEAQFLANDGTINELTDNLREAQGAFGELFGAARSAANDLATQLDASIISGQLPGRTGPLLATAQSRTLPSVEELENIYLTNLEEMVAQAQVAKFTASAFNAAGDRVPTEMVRIGPFVAFSDGSYYTMKKSANGPARLQQLSRQPAEANAVPNANSVASFSGAGYTAGTIDPTTGQLISLVVETPTLADQFEAGGLVGKAIVGVFALGMVIGLYKLVTLTLTNGAVRGQMRKKKAGRGNPLGRVMMAYESNTSADVETLELKLDDAVLKELPKLDSGLNLVKVFAGIAPLMGLLGTVVGMIKTFQQITLFGTGDPQIMAGGISLALITTVLGLIAAIPLLLVHALASGTAKSISSVLEEQAAGMVAEHAESRA